MNLTQIKQHIQTRNLSPVYIFTGDEVGVMNIYIKQMQKVSGKQIIRLDTFKEVFNIVSKPALMKSPAIYVVRDDAEVQNLEVIWNVLKKADWKDTVILVFSNIDKRTKFYKMFEDRICVFDPLEDNVLVKYIQREIPLSEKNCKILIDICEHSYSRIMLEIDKIKTYAIGMDYTLDDKVWNHVFQELLDNGVIYKPAQDAIFDWSDTVADRRKKKSFELMQECFDCGEATMVMLSVLYNNLRHILQVQTAGKDIAQETGLTGWQIKCAKAFENRYDEKELLNALQIIRQMEKGVKTGEVEEQIAVPYVLVNIL